MPVRERRPEDLAERQAAWAEDTPALRMVDVPQPVGPLAVWVQERTAQPVVSDVVEQAEAQAPCPMWAAGRETTSRRQHFPTFVKIK